MSQTLENHVPSAVIDAGSRWQGWLQVAGLAVLLGVLYHRVFAQLAVQWWTDANYSHGFLVPFFCGWLIWRQRKKLSNIPKAPTSAGLFVIVGALGILVLGVLGAENFLARTSLLFLVAGLVIDFCGWHYFRALIFPWAVLFLMVPLPAILFNQVALPLQFLASRLASGLLELVGVPVLREGNVINLPSLSLDVAEACSGLRSLFSLITLSVFYGCVFESRVSRRLLLVLSSVPIAVAANGIRIAGSGILGQYWDPSKAEGFYHLLSGWLIFVLCLGLLMLFHAILRLTGPRAQSRHV